MDQPASAPAPSSFSALPFRLPTELLFHLVHRCLTARDLFTGLGLTSRQAHGRLIRQQKGGDAAAAVASASASSVDTLHRLMLRRILARSILDGWRMDAASSGAHAESGSDDAEEERRLLMRLLHVRASRGGASAAKAISSRSTQHDRYDEDSAADLIISLAGFPSLFDLAQWYPASPSSNETADEAKEDSAGSSAPVASHYHLLRQLLPVSRLIGGHWRGVRSAAPRIDDLAVSDHASAVAPSDEEDPWPLGRFVTIEWDSAQRKLLGTDRSIVLLNSSHANGAIPFFECTLRPFDGAQAEVQCHASKDASLHGNGRPIPRWPAQVFPVGTDGWRLFMPELEGIPTLAASLVGSIQTAILRDLRARLPHGPHVEFARLPIKHPDWVGEGVIQEALQLSPQLLPIWRRVSCSPSSIFFRPPSPFPPVGLHTAFYGGHGGELFFFDYQLVDREVTGVLQSESQIEVDQATQPLNWLVIRREADGESSSHAPAPPSSRSLSLILRATKVLGDANVPAGKASFRVVVGESWEATRMQCHMESVENVLAPSYPMDVSEKIEPLDADEGAPAAARNAVPSASSSAASSSAKTPATSSASAPGAAPSSASNTAMSFSSGADEAATAAGVLVEDDANEDEEEFGEDDEEEEDEEMLEEEEEEESAAAAEEEDEDPSLRVRVRGKGLVANSGHRNPRLIPVHADVYPGKPLRLYFLTVAPYAFRPYQCDCAVDKAVHPKLP